MTPDIAGLAKWCDEMVAWCDTENVIENARQFGDVDRKNWAAIADLLRAGNPWKDAVIDALVISFVYRKEHEDDPKRALGELIDWENQVALDPAVSLKARELVESGKQKWTSTLILMPPDETPVLIVRNGKVCIGERRWDRPTFEETYQAYQYWDDPGNDGQEWHDKEITHWMPLPEVTT